MKLIYAVIIFLIVGGAKNSMSDIPEHAYLNASGGIMELKRMFY